MIQVYEKKINKCKKIKVNLILGIDKGLINEINIKKKTMELKDYL